MDNLSQIFGNNVLNKNSRQEEEQQMLQLQQQQLMMQQQQQLMMQQTNEHVLNNMNPINFEEKIMGGNNFSNFMSGKLSPLDGMFNYSQRVNALTGKGVINMGETFNDNKIDSIIGSGINSDSKLSMYLGGDNTGNKLNVILGLTKPGSKTSGYLNDKSSRTIDNILSSHKAVNGVDKINSMLNMRNDMKQKKQKQPVKDMSDMFGIKSSTKFMDAFSKPKFNNTVKLDKTGFLGNKPFEPLNINKKLSGMFQFKNPLNDGVVNGVLNYSRTGVVNSIKNTNNTLQNNPAKNINQLFGVFGNPEMHALKRMQQQTGLSMFGDYDGDKMLNVFDCDPYDPNRQGEQHDIVPYLEPGRPVANSEYDEQYSEPVQSTYNIYTGPVDADINNDGVINEQDRNDLNSLTIDEQLLLIANKIQKGENPKAYKTLYEELLKTKRASDEFGFKQQRYTDEKTDKERQEQKKTEQAREQLKFARERFAFEKEREYAMFREKQKQQDFSDKLKLFGLGYQVDRDVAKDEQQAKREGRAFALEKEKLRQAEQKNDILLMESRLRAGKNLMDGLLGGGNKFNASALTGMGDGRGSQNPVMLTGSLGGNPGAMMSLVGGVQSAPFGARVQETVGAQPMQKSFVQTVSESVSKQTPEEFLKEQQERQRAEEELRYEQQIQNQNRQYAPQPQMQYAPQPQMQPRPQIQVQPQPGYYQPSYNVQYDVNWNELSPVEAARYDPQYAKYLADTKGDITYRRGPYKKRR